VRTYRGLDPEQYPAPAEDRRHPEIRDYGQHADRGEERLPVVSRPPESGGSPGEAGTHKAITIMN
jgi:hypothetical protein